MTSIQKKQPPRSESKKNIPFLEIIIGTFLAVMIWRGTWWLLDKYFLPNDPLLSHILCVIIPLLFGLIIALINGYRLAWNVSLENILD
jgi:Fuseless